MKSNKDVCPRIQRAFLAWLDAARPRLKRDIILRSRTDRVIRFEFDVGAPVLSGILQRDEIVIAVEDNELTWDLLADFETLPACTKAGVICTLCSPEEQLVFVSREELWHDHLFEPLLQWVNEKLAPATAIALFQSGGATWAKLIVAPEEAAGASKIVASRLDEKERRGR